MNFLNRLFSKVSKPNSESQIQDSAQSTNDKTTKIRRIRKSNANLNIATPTQSEMQKWIGLFGVSNQIAKIVHCISYSTALIRTTMI